MQDLTALGVAITYGNIDCIEFLVSVDDDRVAFETGVRKDPLGASLHNVSAVHMAAVVGNGRLLELLLARHLPYDLRDSDDATPLHYAAEGNSSVSAAVLLEAALEKGDKGVDNTRRVWVERLLSMKTRQWQLTALHVAVLHKNCEVASLLVEWNADAAQRAVGLSAASGCSDSLVSFNTLHLAVRSGSTEISSMLLSAAPSLINS